jgi:hypothetical protein
MKKVVRIIDIFVIVYITVMLAVTGFTGSDFSKFQYFNPTWWILLMVLNIYVEQKFGPKDGKQQ